jgi:hypothetical protein
VARAGARFGVSCGIVLASDGLRRVGAVFRAGCAATIGGDAAAPAADGSEPTSRSAASNDSMELAATRGAVSVDASFPAAGAAAGSARGACATAIVAARGASGIATVAGTSGARVASRASMRGAHGRRPQGVDTRHANGMATASSANTSARRSSAPDGAGARPPPTGERRSPPSARATSRRSRKRSD